MEFINKIADQALNGPAEGFNHFLSQSHEQEAKRPADRGSNFTRISPIVNLDANDSIVSEKDKQKTSNKTARLEGPTIKNELIYDNEGSKEDLDGAHQGGSYCRQLNQFKYSKRPNTQGLKTSPERILGILRH